MRVEAVGCDPWPRAAGQVRVRHCTLCHETALQSKISSPRPANSAPVNPAESRGLVVRWCGVFRGVFEQTGLIEQGHRRSNHEAALASTPAARAHEVTAAIPGIAVDRRRLIGSQAQ